MVRGLHFFNNVFWARSRFASNKFLLSCSAYLCFFSGGSVVLALLSPVFFFRLQLLLLLLFTLEFVLVTEEVRFETFVLAGTTLAVSAPAGGSLTNLSTSTRPVNICGRSHTDAFSLGL
jgi:hypothetical protein